MPEGGRACMCITLRCYSLYTSVGEKAFSERCAQDVPSLRQNPTKGKCEHSR